MRKKIKFLMAFLIGLGAGGILSTITILAFKQSLVLGILNTVYSIATFIALNYYINRK